MAPFKTDHFPGRQTQVLVRSGWVVGQAQEAKVRLQHPSQCLISLSRFPVQMDIEAAEAAKHQRWRFTLLSRLRQARLDGDSSQYQITTGYDTLLR